MVLITVLFWCWLFWCCSRRLSDPLPYITSEDAIWVKRFDPPLLLVMAEVEQRPHNVNAHHTGHGKRISPI